MRQLAEDVWVLRGFPPDAINVYLVGRAVGAHALTHAHPDHQGASHEICETLGIPLWCGAGDVDAMETAGLIRARQPQHPLNTLFNRVWTGPPHPVARALREGDEVAGFTVLETPGHSAGHVAYWRERDRVLILGDVLTNMDTTTGVPGLHEPKPYFTPDPARNRESARRLAALEPALVCFGHGRPLRDAAKLAAFVAGLGE
jgi:glyoxylase-like metal-dependent hydrolase (beta-lactamase superfamily II)